jgi:hypothetical protein
MTRVERDALERERCRIGFPGEKGDDSRLFEREETADGFHHPRPSHPLCAPPTMLDYTSYLSEQAKLVVPDGIRGLFPLEKPGVVSFLAGKPNPAGMGGGGGIETLCLALPCL